MKPAQQFLQTNWVRDIWTAMVTPNDGMDDGEILSIDLISNTAPVAVITAPDKLVKGAMVIFSATDSTDVDGAVVTAIWNMTVQ